MVVKLKDKFEKTRQVKNDDKSKTFFFEEKDIMIEIYEKGHIVFK